MSKRSRFVTRGFVVFRGEKIDLSTVPGSWVWAFNRKLSRAENMGERGPTGRGVTASTMCGNSSVLGAYDLDNAVDMWHDDKPRRTRHVLGSRAQPERTTTSHCTSCEWCGALCEWDVCRRTSKLIAFDRSTGAVHRCDPAHVKWMRDELTGAALSSLATYRAAKKLVATFTPLTPDTITLNPIMRMHSARDMYLELRARLARFYARCASDGA